MPKSICFIVLFFVLLMNLSHAQINKSGNAFYKNYTTEIYRAGTQNLAVVQDKRGVMYFGNNYGVLKYDGTTWQLIRINNQSVVSSLAVGNDNTKYVGGENEFGYLDVSSNGIVKYISLSGQLDSANQNFTYVNSIYLINGNVFFCTPQYIFKYDKENIEVFQMHKGGFLSFLCNNEIYTVDYFEGLLKLSEEGLVLCEGGEFYKEMDVFFIMPHKKEDLILGSQANGIYIYNLKTGLSSKPDNVYLFEIEKFLLSNRIYGGLKLRNDVIINSLGAGAQLFNKDFCPVEEFSEEFGLQDDYVISMYQKSTDNPYSPLWLGLDNGISKVEINSPFRIYGEINNLSDEVFDIEVFDDVVYVSTTDGIYYLDETSERYPQFVKVENTKNQCWKFLLLDKHLFASSYNIYSVEGCEAVESSINAETYQLSPSNSKDLFFAASITGVSVLRKEGNEFSYNSKIDEINQKVVRILSDQEYFWTLTAKGKLWRVTANKTDTLADEVSFLEKDAQHQIIVGMFKFNDEALFTTEDGVYTFDDESEKLIICDTLDQELYEAAKGSSLAKQINNDWWFAKLNSRNIIVAKPTADSYVLDSTTFLRLNATEINAIKEVKDGEVWVATTEGLYIYNNKSLGEDSLKYSVNFSSIIINDDSVLFGGGYFFEKETNNLVPQLDVPQINYKNNNISFYYSAASYIEEERNLYIYKLEGYDEKWSAWTDKTSKSYTGIREGEYVFKVKSKNLFEQESQIEKYEFVVLPPWYRKWWAYLMYAFFIVLFFFSSIKLYTRRLRLAKLKLEKTVHNRTLEINKQKEELKALNKYIGEQRDRIKEELENTIVKAEALRINNLKLQTRSLADQMNPHFIFNTLTNFQVLAIKNDSDLLNQYIVKFAKLMRLILEHSQKETISLSSEISALVAYLELEKLKYEDKFDYVIQIDPKMDPEEIKIPSLLIQPFLENSIIHGFSNKNKRGIIQMRFLKKGNYLHCLIEDNGIGRKKSTEDNKKSRRGHISYGTNITNERLTNVSKLHNKRTELKYTDLTNKEGKPAGTRVEIVIEL